jgi:S1-C subfamily serine protease
MRLAYVLPGLSALLLALAGLAALPGPPPPALAGVLVSVTSAAGAGHGSGVHTGGGAILTAAHVVEGAERVAVRLSDGRSLDAGILWASPPHDLALLHVEAANVEARELRCTPLSAGEEVFNMANPLSLEFVAIYGRIAGPPRAVDGFARPVLPLDMTVAPGMSGGPLIDAAGRVAGIIVATFLRAPIGMAVPASDACRLLAHG